MTLASTVRLLAPLGMTISRNRGGLFLDRLALGRVLLCVNHHAFERVDRAQHLWIRAFNEILVFVRLNRVAAASRRERLPFLVEAHRNSNVWLHTVAVNDLLNRCVIFRARMS